jgi:hypothetical protein
LTRQSGKSTYIKKLYSHMQDMNHNPIIVTPRKRDADHNFGRNFETKTIQQLTDIRMIMGKKWDYDVIFFDEVHPIEAKKALGLITPYENIFSSKIDFVLGLYT